MNEAVILRVKKLGHWRVNLRPLAAPSKKLTLPECQEAVEQSAVSIRGWDFPHIARANSPTGGIERTADYVGTWTDWSGMIEFWRMYRSSQFLSYVALREDTRPEGHDSPDEPVLNFLSALYSITEFFEFANRLGSHGLLPDGVRVSISLLNSKGRRLVAGRGRIPLFEDYRMSDDAAVLLEELDRNALLEKHREAAVRASLELFNIFGWNPAASQLAAEQQNFYDRKFGY
jgi:hypothetical protein